MHRKPELCRQSGRKMAHIHLSIFAKRCCEIFYNEYSEKNLYKYMHDLTISHFLLPLCNQMINFA